MYARLNAIGFRAEAIPEALERYKAETLPMIRSWPGYLMTFAMAQRSTGKVIMLSFWERAEDRDASGLRIEYVQNLASYGHLIGGSMSRETHDVVVSTLPDRPEDSAELRLWARVTTGQVLPEHWDAALAMLQPMVEDSGDNRAHLGSILLVNRTMAKVVVVGIWDSRRAISATDDEVHAQAYLVRRSGYLTSSPTHEVYEIVSWG